MDAAGLGALAAVAASALFSVGLVLQAMEARTVSAAYALKLSLVVRLARRPRWLLGALVMLAGFGLHVLALSAAPLSVVQPALAAGLLMLLAIGLRTHSEPVGRREVLGVTGIVAGVIGLTFATPARTIADGERPSVALALGTLAVVALVPHALAVLRVRRGDEGTLLATLGAGAGYALTGLTTKFFADSLVVGDPLDALGWLALTALGAVLALIDQTSALQRQGAIEVGPIVFVVPVVVPVLLAPALLGEGWAGAPLGGAPLLAALTAVCAGAVVLAGSRPVAAAGSAPVARSAASPGEGPVGLGCRAPGG